jgi:subtilisin family serine protease
MLALGLLGLAACHGGHKKHGATPDAGGPDAGAPMHGDGDGDGQDGVDGSTPPVEEPDAGTLSQRCETACGVFSPILQQACGRSDEGQLLARWGLKRAPHAAAFALASSDAHVTRELRAMAGASALYAPTPGVVLLTRPTAAALTMLRARAPGLRELPVLSNARGSHVVVSGRIVLRVRAGADVDAALRTVGARRVRALGVGKHTYLAEVDEPMASFAAAEKLALHKGVVYAQPSLLRSYQKRAPIADPLTQNQWHLLPSEDSKVTASSHIMADLAWRVSEGKPEVVVAIYDDGVDFEHVDLKDAVVPGLNVPTDLTQAIQDSCCWHGTGVAGVAVAQANDVGLRGVCPTCALMPVFDPAYGLADGSNGMMLSDDALTAETFTEACKTAAVINNSWGPADGDPTVADDDLPAETLAAVIDEAFQGCEANGRGGLGTVIVFAAGNGNESMDVDPFASHPLVLSVAASDDLGRKAYYSDFGKALDVTAPSSGGRTTGIWTTALRGTGNQGDGHYMDDFGGTSSAAPVVTGLVGLVLSVNPQLKAAEVRALLAQTADKIDRLNGAYDAQGFSEKYGFGRVNAYRAVRAAEQLAGTCQSLGEELCNGIDDDCDGQLDEDCTKVPTCGACALDAMCESGLCAQTDNDTEPRCLAPCNEGACSDGFTCQAGLCVPPKGRCAEPAQEVCNSVDDDLNGTVDEGVCPADTYCQVDAACADGELCVGGSCRPTCTTASDCENDSADCVPRTGRYGEPDGQRICSSDSDLCVTYVCWRVKASVEVFGACLDTIPITCEAAYACIPDELQ